MSIRVLSIGLLCFLSVLAVFSFEHDRLEEAMAGGEIVPGHIIFKISEEAASLVREDGVLPPALQGVLQSHGVRSVMRVFPAHNPPEERNHSSGRRLADLSRIYETVAADARSMPGVMQALAATGLTDYVQPRPLPRQLLQKGEALYVPNDSLVPHQYYLTNISAYRAWAVTRGDTNFVVGIVDTGVELDHPDLIDAIAYNYDDPINGEDSDNDGYVDNFYGWDLGEGNNDPTFTTSAHGIHVSGIAAASADNGKGIAGVGFHTRFLPVKVSDEVGRLIKAYEGIVYAVDQGVDVVNCSWGSHFYSGPFGQDIIDYAVLNNDVLVVAAAGNADNDEPFYPASFDHVVSVAATDSLDQKAGFSSYGPFVDLSAPGHMIMSTWVDGSYVRGNGTSMASPAVAGAAALLRSYYPSLDALQIAALLKTTADNIDHVDGNEDYQEKLGFGRLNMFRSLTETHHPYIRLAEHFTSREALGQVGPGQEFELKMTVQNMLAPAESVSAVIGTSCEFVTSLSDTISFGHIDSLQFADNRNFPFRMYAKEDLDANHNVVFTVQFLGEDNQRIGRSSFIRVLNKDYLNIEAGPIKTSISSLGAVGFNYPDYFQGYGLTYNDGYTVIRNAGIVIADGPGRVADNIYGAREGSFSQSLQAKEYPALHPEHLLAPVVAQGRLKDRRQDGEPPMDIEISYSAYFWDHTQPKDYFILDYRVVNNSATTYDNLHAGFFADWVLRNNKMHRARMDVQHRLAYAFEEGGASYTGIQFLGAGDVNHYAFDNQGFDDSIDISQGFSDEDKFRAMTESRDQAGIFSADNDISSMVSFGPSVLAPGDSLSFGFAIHLADNLPDMQRNASEAHLLYLSIQDLQHDDPPCPDPLVAYPNPNARDFMTVRFCPELSGDFVLSLYGVSGARKKSRSIQLDGGEPAAATLQVSELSAGVYILQLRGRNNQYSIRVVIA